jgi:hypothetical protein
MEKGCSELSQIPGWLPWRLAVGGWLGEGGCYGITWSIVVYLPS